MYLVENSLSSSYVVNPEFSGCCKKYSQAISTRICRIKQAVAVAFSGCVPIAAAATVVAVVVLENTFAAAAALTATVAFGARNLFNWLDEEEDKALNKKICFLDGAQGGCAVIKAVVLTTLKEMMALTAISAVTSLFVASELGMVSLAGGVVIATCVNLFFRVIGSVIFLIGSHRNPETQKLEMPEGKAKKVIRFFEWIAPLNYSFVHCHTLDTVIHEAGHAFAIQTLYSQAKTQIQIAPYVKAFTNYSVKGLSALGALLGANRSTIVAAAAGPAAAVGAAAAELVLAKRFERDHPQLSRYLKVMGAVNIAFHVVYAYSAFFEASQIIELDLLSTHDFVRIWAGGIHPCISIISMLVAPLILKAGLHFLKPSTKQPEVALSTG